MAPALLVNGLLGSSPMVLAAAAAACTSSLSLLRLGSKARGISSAASSSRPHHSERALEAAGAAKASARRSPAISGGSSIRSFAAQPALAENAMFCFQ